MSDLPVLRTRYVERKRLRDALRLEPEVRLVLVSAPAGFGKTTLVADWLRAQGMPHAWLSLAPSDDDPVRLGRRIVEVVSGEAVGVDTLGAGTDGAADEALAAIAEAIERRGQPIALVLDDTHVVGSVVHAIIGRLLERVSRGVVLVLTCRADPSLPLARLRARGQLVEVRGDALRFTQDEAGRFLRDTMGLGLSEPQVAALVARTEGWAVGLQLAGLALRGRPDPDAFIEQFSGTNRFVLDYLLDEVLALQSDEVQRFLVETSVLERMSADLCEAVTGGPGAQAMLERLERENLFVVALDEERHSYRYHRLFADLLRARLVREEPAAAPELHARAARWFRDHEAPDEAISHALSAGDTAFAVDLIGRQWVPYGHRGEVATVRRWLEALPAELVRHDPILSAAYAWMCVLAGRHAEAEPRLRDAELAYARMEPDDSSPAWLRSVPAQIALMRAAVVEARGDPIRARSEATLALASIPPDLDPDLAAVLRGEGAVSLGYALASLGERDLAASAYRDALPLLWRGGNPFGVAMAAMRLADLEVELGRVDVALETCRGVLREAEASRLADAPAMAAVHAALGRALLASRDADGAVREAVRALELARRGGQHRAAEAAEALLIRARAGNGAASGALSNPAGGVLAEPLTAREMDVLRLLGEGRSNRQIAAELFLAVGTVKFHVHAVLGKLGAASRLDAVLRARSLGLIR